MYQRIANQLKALLAHLSSFGSTELLAIKISMKIRNMSMSCSLMVFHLLNVAMKLKKRVLPSGEELRQITLFLYHQEVSQLIMKKQVRKDLFRLFQKRDY